MATQQQAIEAKEELKSIMTGFNLVSGIGYGCPSGNSQDFGVVIRLSRQPSSVELSALPDSHTTKSNAKVDIQYLVPGSAKPQVLKRS